MARCKVFSRSQAGRKQPLDIPTEVCMSLSLVEGVPISAGKFLKMFLNLVSDSDQFFADLIWDE